MPTAVAGYVVSAYVARLPGRRWGVAKWYGNGFWSRDRRFESCRPSHRFSAGQLSDLDQTYRGNRIEGGF